MPCCGQKRAALKKQLKTENKEVATTMSPPQKKVKFQYIGNSQLQLYGAISKRKYIFSSKGMILEVDEQDASSMFAEPYLQAI